MDAADPSGRSRNRGSLLWLGVAIVIVLWLARAVLGPFVVAAVIAYAFSPFVTAGVERTRLPRIAVVAIEYGIAVLIIAALVFFLAGRIAGELQLLAAQGPDAVARTLRDVLGTDAIELGGQRITVAAVARQIQSGVSGLFATPGDAVHLATQVGELGLQAILTLIVTFYFLVDGQMLRDRTVDLLPARERARTADLLTRIHTVLGKWLRGQLLLIALVAAVVYIVLGPILHVPYALAVAVLTGILEVIPLVGPLIATVIAGTDAFVSGGPSVAVIVVVFYFVLRQIEDQVVMPVVIGRAVHLHPVITIFAVLVGLSAYGILGGLLGVPIAAALNVVFRELYPAPTHTAADPTASAA